MQVLEFKLVAKETQKKAMDEAIRTAQFVRNKCLRHWMDEAKVGKYDLTAYCVPLRKEYDWAGKLDAQARQAAAERAWSSIAAFYRRCKEGAKKKGYPKFEKRGRSVEYKQTGWKLSSDCRFITFTDGNKIGTMKLIDKRCLNDTPIESIKRVRILRRADGYYCQFVTNTIRSESQEPTGRTIGIDVGLASFYTDSNGEKVPCLKSLRKGEKRLKRAQRRVSRKKKGSVNRKKAREKLARQHLKVSRQRKDFACKTARALCMSNDVIAYEDLQVQNMVKNHHLAKSINDAAWSGFVGWIEYFGGVFGKVTIGVPAAFTSQDCSGCGERVKKDLSVRVHSCACGLVMDRDENAARNVLQRGLELLSNGTGGQSETGSGSTPNAWGEGVSPSQEGGPR